MEGYAGIEGACVYFTAIFPCTNQPVQQWRTIKRAAMQAIIANGGTLSHRRGLGADHAERAAAEKGAIGIKLMSAVAGTLDPNGVLATGARKAVHDRK